MKDNNHNQQSQSKINQEVVDSNKGLINFFVSHKVAGNLLMALLILFGLYGLSQLKRQIMPDFGLEIVNINIEWIGASAEDIEANIIEAIEPEIRFINQVDKVDSTAYEGKGIISIHFAEDASMSSALSDVQSAVARITTFPQDMEKLIISEIVQKDEVCRIDISGPFSEKTLKYFARQMRDDLVNMGLANVEFEGDRDPEIWIEVPANNLKELKLSIEDISTRVSASSIDLPSGSTNSGGISTLIRSEQLAKTPQELRNIEVVSMETGEKLYLKDIANIFETYQENSDYQINSEGRSIGLTVFRTQGADSLVSHEIVEEYMDELLLHYPQSLKVMVFDVFADAVRERLFMLLKNGALGLALVLLVLFIFLSGRVAFWVAIGMPAAYLAALGAMSVLGMSLDMVSMFALTMGIGIVVDDAIVVSEHTTTLHRRGIPYLDAARRAAQIMFAPVLAASLTTIAAFLPVLMLGAEVGNIIAPIPIALSLIILGSLIECFLIMPSHLKTSLKRMERLDKKEPRKFDVVFNHFRDHYVIPLVRRSYAKKGFTVLATLCMFIISINLLSSGRILFEFFMTPEVDSMHANVSFSPGTTDDVTEQMVYELARSAREAETILTNGEGGLIKFGVGSIGEGSSGRGLAINDTTGSHIGAYMIELVTGDEREVRNMPFMKTWKESTRLMPGIENFIIFESAAGGPPGRDLDIRIIGADMQTTKLAALELRRKLRNLPGLIAVTDDLPFGKQEILLELTPEGEAMGFSAQEVARQVRNSFSGAVAQRFAQDAEEILVRVKLPESETINQTVRDIYLQTPDKNDILLSEVVTFKKGLGFTKIRRQDGIRQVSVSGDVDPSVTTTNVVLQTVRKEIAPDIEKRFNVQIDYKGKAEEQAEAFADMSLALIITFASIYIILAWLFSSYTTPFLVMSVVPFGLIGAIIGHYLMGFNLGMFSLLALLGLTGVLVNDSIILVTTIKRFIADGLDLSVAVLEGTRERLRPVILTTLTTILGLTPILFERSLQAQLVQPLAITFVFGMLFSPFLVLFYLPAVMGIAESFKNNISSLVQQIKPGKRQYS